MLKENGHGSQNTQLPKERSQLLPTIQKKRSYWINKEETTMKAQRRIYRANQADEISQQGILSLINKRKISKSSDLIAHILHSGSIMHVERTIIYPGLKQFEKRQIHTIAEYGADYSNLKFDNDNPNSSHTHRKIKNPKYDSRQTPVSVVPFGGQVQATIYSRKEETGLSFPNLQPPECIADGITSSESSPRSTEKENPFPRRYGELLDEYSLHEIIIRKGTTLTSTPEFMSFKRKYKYNWNTISLIINLLEILMNELHVPTAYVDGKAVARLAQCRQERISVDQLLDCLINYDTVKPLVDVSKYRDLKGSRTWASTTISKYWRMHAAKKKLKQLKQLNSFATTIQKWWRIKLAYAFTRRTIERVRIAEEIRWKNKMSEFVKNWNTIKRQGYVALHIPSHSFDEDVRKGMVKLSQKQNSQILRLLDLVFNSQILRIIYICSVPCDDQFLNYLFHLLLLHTATSEGNTEKETKRRERSMIRSIKKKISFIHPSEFNRLPEHYSLCQKLFLSERSLRLLRTQIMLEKQKLRHYHDLTETAECSIVMIPGVRSSYWELRLAQRLQIPLMGIYERSSLHYNTKSSSRRLLEFAEVNIPPGAIDLHNQQEILIYLSKLIVQYPQYNRWLLKINHQHESRGHGYIDVHEGIECLSEQGRSKIYEKLRRHRQEGGFLEALQDSLYYELETTIESKFKICRNDYKNWKEFTIAISKAGCVIEAVPENIVGNTSVNLLIEPNGKVVMHSIQENILFPNYCVIGCAHIGGYDDTPSECDQDTNLEIEEGGTDDPRMSKKILDRNLNKAMKGTKGFGNPVPYEVLLEASSSVANVLYSKHVMGYVTIDYIAFATENNSLKLWGVDLDLGMSDRALFHSVYRHVVRDLSVGQRLTKSYIYGNLMGHSAFSQWMHETFFALCRQKGIGFDLDALKGTLFQLVDGMLQSFLGVICIGDSVVEAITEYKNVITFIHSLVKDETDSQSNIDHAYHCIHEIVGKLISKSTESSYQ